MSKKTKNIIKTGSVYKIFGDDIKGMEKLPAVMLKVNFNPMSGYSLEEAPAVQITQKIYGQHVEKAQKVLKSFKMANKSMGVMYGGMKGTGKSLSAQYLIKEGMKLDYPTIVVDSATEGLKEFLNSIEQDVIVLFDEFEKNFHKNEQDNLLNLFDGLNANKKLFILTYNDSYALTQYVHNRPGRFRYKFNFDSLSNEVLEEYLSDHVNNCTPELIKSIVFLNDRVKITFDYLNAICTELNQGYTLAETLEDLNIDFKNESNTFIGTVNVYNKLARFKFDSRALSDTYTISIKVSDNANKHKYLLEAVYCYVDIDIPIVNFEKQDNGEYTIKSINNVKFEKDIDMDNVSCSREELEDAMEDVISNIDIESLKFREEYQGVQSFDLSKLTV